MTALKPIPPKKMVVILLRLGFQLDRQRGSHAYYKHTDGPQRRYSDARG